MSYKPFQMPTDVWEWLKKQAALRSAPGQKVSMAEVLREVVADAQQNEQAASTPAAVRE
jgi:hypothetical protein